MSYYQTNIAEHAEPVHIVLPDQPEQRPSRDPYLLSDDEVFLDSAASSAGVSSAAVSSAIDVEPVVVRMQYIAKASPLTGKQQGYLNEVCTNKKTPKYSRNPTFGAVLSRYESEYQPKCKTSLNDKLFKSNDNVRSRNVRSTIDDVDKNALTLYAGNVSSRSSLNSVQSIEWDRCKDFTYRTRSLPRRKVTEHTQRLYRTQSHSGFVSTKDPDPSHFHVPKCNSCGAINSSYVWETLKRKISLKNHLGHASDVPKLQALDSVVVKVKEVFVPTYHLPKTQTAEFVNTQEFDEDNYLEIGSSFASSDQTVVEKTGVSKVESKPFVEEHKDIKMDNNVEDTTLYKAVCVTLNTSETEDINDINNNDSMEGEYHSFTDELDFEKAVYESPVKDLVQKDIRDYSVPIDCYYEDYATKVSSPKKSPQKRHEIPKLVALDPILEESKSSYGEESYESSKSYKTGDRDGKENIKEGTASDETVLSVENKSSAQEESRQSIELKPAHDIAISTGEIKETNERQQTPKLNTGTMKFEDYKNVADLKMFNDNNIVSVDIENKADINRNENINSVKLSVESSTNETTSFNSTVEFEKLEVVTDIIFGMLNKINYEYVDSTYDLHKEENVHEIADLSDNNISDNLQESVKDDPNNTVEIQTNQEESFSITQIIKNIEGNELKASFNETASTDASDSESTHSIKIVEAIIYFLFDRAFFVCANKNKGRSNKLKTVITVVDSEDVLFTALPLWVERDLTNTEIEIYHETHITKNRGSEVQNKEEKVKINECGCNNDTNDSLDLIPCKEVPNECIFNEAQDSVGECENVNFSAITDKTEIYFEEGTEIPTELDRTTSCDDSFWTVMNCTDLEDDSEGIASNTVCDVIEKSFLETEIDGTQSDLTNLNETFSVDANQEKMNTAFVENSDFFSRSSSPQHDNVFDVCTESPIKHTTGPFVGENLSVYEKDDTILGSPFVKRAPVISMSQTAHSGGIKYWLSFDERYTERDDSFSRRVKRFREVDLPSFVVVDFDKSVNKKDTKDKHRGVLLDDHDSTSSFNEASSSYKTCESEVEKVGEVDITKSEKRLLYDARSELQMPRRKYSSWPPYEQTLFYRIISKFRMSESFDPNDVDTFENSL
ncbi:uncharacterized protein [Epargyreus clarus]|uniref:uncharacterized protein n=1 Tax=Epargyreus clarus TaxID=520877 RepID=UPI003C2F9105